MLPKERFARVWLYALLVVFGLYFCALQLEGPQQNLSFLQRIGQLAVALGSLGAIAIGTRLYECLRGATMEAEDERDRAIELRAASYAYYVLMTGIIIAGCIMPFEHSGWELVHASLGAIALAEMVHAYFVIRGYRGQ